MWIKEISLIKYKEKRNNKIYSKLQKVQKMLITIEQIKDWEL